MLRCNSYLGLRLLRTTLIHPGRRGYIHRPLPDDIDDYPKVTTPVPRPTPALTIQNLDIHSKLTSCATIDDVCGIYSQYRSRLRPKELVLVLSRIVELGCRRSDDTDSLLHTLWPETDFCLVNLSGLRGKLELLRLPRPIGDVYTDVISRVDSFSQTELLYLLRIGSYIRGYHNHILRSHAERVLTSGIWRLDHLDLCRAVAVLGNTGSVDFAKLLGHVCLKRFIELHSQERIFIFNALSTARHGSSLFLQGCIRHALNADIFTGRDVIPVLIAYARKASCCPPSVFESLLKRSVNLDPTTLDSLEICDLLWVTTKFSDNGLDTFRRFEKLLLPHCHDLPGRSVSMLLWALSESGYESPDLTSALESAAIATCGSMSPTHVSICIHSLSRLRALSNAPSFHEHIQDDIIDTISHFNGLDLAMLAEGYARLGLGSATLHQCIQESSLKYVEDLPADCLSKLLWSYGHLVGLESFFLGLQFALLQRVNQFSPHDLCRALWAYAVHRFFDLTFWSNCLSMLDADSVRGNTRCYLLYPALCELTSVHKQLLTSDIIRLMNLTKPMFVAKEHGSYCDTTGEHLLDALASLGISASTGTDHKGFLLDASFTYQDIAYAVLVYTHSNTIGSKSPSGGMILKSRFLRRQGIKVIHVLRDSFISMNAKERVALLSRQL
ncbi:hypothetical protein BaOVIS_019600 [Babesia ovis]|uniref:RAP domain-containing protein n=1 Tax=Babesia ovis TaxID=5869 RepID=A0A9W5TBD7_BABOV|nr:hypothetical protein BaOVIS_019600 [Babesia ovis]